MTMKRQRRLRPPSGLHGALRVVRTSGHGPATQFVADHVGDVPALLGRWWGSGSPDRLACEHDDDTAPG